MSHLCLFFIWIFILSCLMNSTHGTNCSHTEFTPYKCQLLAQANKSLKFPCIVRNRFGCKNFKRQIPPKDFRLETVHLVSINLYSITYSHNDEHYAGETYTALNFTISLPSGDMLASCRAVRVNIWNNDTNTGYGRNGGFCRLFDFNLSTLIKKNIRPAYINHKCFTAITAHRYFLNFTTLPYYTEIIYSIIIEKASQVIIAIAPVHHQKAISIILHIPVTNICKNKFRLTSFQTARETFNFSMKNNFLFKNLQPGFYRVRVESNCLATGQSIESDIIQLNFMNPISEAKRLIWILSSVTFIILIFLCLCCCWFLQRKKKYIDRTHKCVIDLLYSSNIKTDRNVAEHLKKLMEEVFEWSVNNVPVDFSMPYLYESSMSNVCLYLMAPDTQGNVIVPHHYKITNVSENNLIKILVYYKQKSNNQISVGFQPSFDIVKDITKLFYFVYRATKNNRPVELFHETYYPKVNNIQRENFWNKFVQLIEDVAELNSSNKDEWRITTKLLSHHYSPCDDDSLL